MGTEQAVRLKLRLPVSAAGLLREAAKRSGRAPEKLLEMLIVNHCMERAIGLDAARPVRPWARSK